ncbi:hypothetical protein BDR06DRAFT_897842, partial [Suillus hirtellus]
IRAVTPIRNRGIIVELDSEELATWLQEPTGRALLEEQFESTISFRSRTFALVLEYLPIRLQLDDTSLLRRVETENSLPADSLSSIRWIKPVARRFVEQWKAFALLHVADAFTANNILQDGICINNEHVNVQKDKKEPIRYAKCQHFGHIACNCTSSVDTCGTCAGAHITSQCNAYRTTKCANCRADDHTSWSHKCPEFLR